MPNTGIFNSFSKLASFRTVSKANFEGVVTMRNSMFSISRRRSSVASPIPGGMSKIRKSSLLHFVIESSSIRAFETSAPLRGVAWSFE